MLGVEAWLKGLRQKGWTLATSASHHSNNPHSSRALRHHKDHSLAGDSARNLLAAVIANAILKESKDSPIRGATYYKWVNYNKDIFPGERTTTYYIPACTTNWFIRY